MAEVDVYNFKAPQFIEALSEVKLDDGADTFFDAVDSANTAPENVINKFASEPCSEANKELFDREEVSTTKMENANDSQMSQKRRPNAKREEKKSTLGKPLKENEENIDPISDVSGPVTRLQRMSVKPNSTLGSKTQPKFLSVAEQIHKFHHSTPPRFKRKSALFNAKSCKFLPTVGHSPQLRTKIRAARPSTAPTPVPEEKPVIRPIKKKEVIKGVSIKPVPKPPTIPVPFNLTMPGNKKQEPQKEDKTENVKEAVNKQKKPTFAAPNNLLRKPLPVKKKRLEIQDNKLTVKESWGVTGIKTIEKPNSTTKTIPFSFEKRNQERLLEKQKKLEEAKEHKNKVPSVASTPRKIPRPNTVSVFGSAEQSKKGKNEENTVAKTPRKSVK